MVILVHENYFNKCIGSVLGPAKGPEANKHNLLNVTSINKDHIPITQYVETDMTFVGLKVPRVRILVVRNLNKVFDPVHNTRLSGHVG